MWHVSFTCTGLLTSWLFSMITLSMLLDLGHRLWLLAYTEPDLLPGVTGAEAGRGRSTSPDLGAGTGLLPYGEECVICLLPGELWVDEGRLGSDSWLLLSQLLLLLLLQ